MTSSGKLVVVPIIAQCFCEKHGEPAMQTLVRLGLGSAGKNKDGLIFFHKVELDTLKHSLELQNHISYLGLDVCKRPYFHAYLAPISYFKIK